MRKEFRRQRIGWHFFLPVDREYPPARSIESPSKATLCTCDIVIPLGQFFASRIGRTLWCLVYFFEDNYTQRLRSSFSERQRLGQPSGAGTPPEFSLIIDQLRDWKLGLNYLLLALSFVNSPVLLIF